MMSTTNELPLVSIIIPVRNESGYITATLDAVARQDYPPDKLEVMVVDGMSTDNTRHLVSEFIVKNPNLAVSLLNNPLKTVPVGLNIAIKLSRGEVIARMDSHSVYPAHYISSLVSALYRYDAHNTGGTLITMAAQDTLKCRAIATALSHPFGVGNAYFRIGCSNAKEVDTVPFGCFRREVFDLVGYFDEEMTRTQDSELNGRIRKAGLKIVLVPGVEATYFARDTFRKLFKMYYQYGLFKPLASLKLGNIPTIRQLIPLLFVLFTITGLATSLLYPPVLSLYAGILTFYLLCTIVAATNESVRQKRPLLFHLAWAFFILHSAYGLGYLLGLIAIILNKREVFKGNVSLSR